MAKVRDEGIKNHQRYENSHIDIKFIEDAIGYIIKKIDENLEIFTYKYPDSSSENNIYPPVGNVDWTSSFWTGMLWLAYEVTGDDKYRRVADIHLKDFKRRLDEGIVVEHHDLGFLYSLSCVAGYKLTGKEDSSDVAIKAANKLITRYFDKAGIIQAWGDLNNPAERGRMIIDCCMNLPLLYWAHGKTGEQRFYDIAYSHALQAAKYIVREDASTFHTFYMDVETGQPKYGKTAQGYSDSSCWSRGQAWGIYGFPLSYAYTGDWGFIEVSKKLANYFLNRLPDDNVCYWDLIFTQGEEERDSSAAAIAVCGLLELAKHLPVSDPYRRIYENAAVCMLKSLVEKYTTIHYPQSNGILLHAVYSKPGGRGVDECCIWGDYYYFEALVRVMKDWKLYW